MNVQWSKLLIRAAIWLVGEVLLGLIGLDTLATWLVGEVLLGSIGLDTLADYSEFVFEHQEVEPFSIEIEKPLYKTLPLVGVVLSLPVV